MLNTTNDTLVSSELLTDKYILEVNTSAECVKYKTHSKSSQNIICTNIYIIIINYCKLC